MGKALHFREIVRHFCDGRWEVRGESKYNVELYRRCLGKVFDP